MSQICSIKMKRNTVRCWSPVDNSLETAVLRGHFRFHDFKFLKMVGRLIKNTMEFIQLLVSHIQAMTSM